MTPHHFTPDEIEAARHLLGYYGHPGGWEPGGFTTALIRTFERADQHNTNRLFRAFPEYTRPVTVLTTDGANHLALKINEARSPQ